MANKLDALKNALGAGARTNKYRLNISTPAAVGTLTSITDADILCKSANFPSMTIGQIEVFNQGRKLIIPGDTSYSNTWTVSFYNTEDHALRKDMIKWMKDIDNFSENTHSGDPKTLMISMSVEQLDSRGNATITYEFENVFPQEVGELTLDDSQNDSIQEFDVTFSFTNWEVSKTSNATQNTVAGVQKKED